MNPLGRSLAIVLVLAGAWGAAPVRADDLAPQAEAARRPRPPRPAGYPVLPGIWRLHGTDPALSQDDLEPLRQVIGKAQIVGLGESIHTSGGYYEMKHRVFRFLVEKMGFRAFGFETPWVGADRVAAYVQTCQGTPEDALQGIFGVWRSSEVRELVSWMCEWNRTHRKPKDRLYFFGFDIQAESQHHAPALVAFLSRIGVGEDDPRVSALSQCEGVEEQIYPERVPDDRHQRCTEALDGIDRLLSENEPAIVRQTSQTDLAWARVRLVALRSWENQSYYTPRDWRRAGAARDQGMAYTLLALRSLRFPKAKAAVWAHNWHLARDAMLADSPWTMGTALDRAVESAYVNLALAGYEVAIDWPNGLGCGLTAPPTLGSVERLLHNLQEDYLLVDLDFPGGDPPFLEPNDIYRLGPDVMIPRQQFDGIVYLERSPKMTPVHRPSCQ